MQGAASILGRRNLLGDKKVKATVKKSTTVKKPVPKAKPAAAKKVAPKPATKSAAKPSKSAAKPAAKPAGKAAVKKAPAKVTKAMAKPSAKPVSKPVKKPLAPVAKTAKSSPPVKVAGKTSAKPVAKKPVMAAPAVKAKPSIPTKAPISVSVKTPAKAPAKAPNKLSVAAATGKPSAKQSAPVPSKPAVAVAVPVAVPPKPRTSKSGFISPANIAPKPMEVSTAAKTNFTMSSPVLAPPPQLAVKKDAKLVNNWKTKTAAQLSDDEAIAMPDAEYMSALQMAFFRLKLVQLKKDILSNAGETTEHLREDTSVVPDPADRATIEEEHALELRTRDRERKLLKKIEQSIARIDSEDYGYCDETGEPIGIARLIARPTANLSLEAQQRRELKQKMFGD
jgi:DnaK suppressor protein